jgi:hypothetical protein
MASSALVSRRQRKRDEAIAEALAWREAHCPPPLTYAEYTLDEAGVAASSFAGRLTFAPAARGAAADSAATVLFAQGLRRLWVDVRVFREMGPPVMCDNQQFLAAFRRLSDRCLAALPRATTVIPVDLDASDLKAMIASLYPDAKIEGRNDPGSGSALPALEPVARRPIDLVVVLGCGRGGTTWFSRLLQCHPLAGGLDDAESWLFELLAPLWKCARTGRLGRDVPLADIETAIAEFTDTILSYAVQRHRPDAARFVEKTPGHVYLIPLIASLYPAAHYLHLVRDGRDVARSLSRMRTLNRRLMPRHGDVGLAATEWKGVLHAVRRDTRDLPASRFREVRYETVFAHPEGELAEIWAWLGLPPSELSTQRVTSIVGERVSTWSGVETGVGTESWRSLSHQQLARVVAFAGDVLVAEGYLTPAELKRWRRQPSYLAGRLARLVAGARRRAAAR